MTTDYNTLRAENRLEYGKAIGRIGKMLLEDRYDKRTHFIFELLQNAEDALRRRSGWTGSRVVRFDLTRQALRIGHFGAPFDAADVRGVCGIDESRKDHTAIGRFGIGFKSVYAFTSRPEVHSGDENFAIEEYVLPIGVPKVERDLEETVILLRLKENDETAFDEIAEGLGTLGAESLLFLREVDEIVWEVAGGQSGRYRREGKTDDGFMRKVNLLTHRDGGEEIISLLLFSRSVRNENRDVGFAEIAFAMHEEDGKPVVHPISDARLVVHFPTVLPTYTGFLVQGPYQTTPSRDNIPSDKAWNKYLVAETCTLLVDLLRYLRDRKMLDTPTLRSLPLNRLKSASGLFGPLFEHIVAALKQEPLIPRAGGQYCSASELRIARAKDVRDLFAPKQLRSLLQTNENIYWLTPDITSDRAPELREYLMRELEIAELTLDSMLSRLSKSYLEEQSDNWIVRLYRLLSTQPALLRGRAKEMALIRLEDGTHVTPMRSGLPQAFLPTAEKTGFPTVRASVCTASAALKFLKALGLTEPDPVDDVIHNLLPGYRKETIDTSSYAEDITRIVRAFQTDSKTHREKLVASLRTASVVMVRDAGTDNKFLAFPGQVYLGSGRLSSLFAGVDGVLIVDSSYACLRGEKVRELLEACGATRYLRLEEAESGLNWEERHQLRLKGGWDDYSHEWAIKDFEIAGLDMLLQTLPKLNVEDRRIKARLLWEALAELLDRRNASVFTVTYQWQYHQLRTISLDARFVRQLNEKAWIPDATGELRRPFEVLFAQLEWPENPVLESKIRFKPPAIAELAREVGIDADVLDELKRLGLTDLEQLRAHLKFEGGEVRSAKEDDEEDHDQGATKSEDLDQDEEDNSPAASEGEMSDAPPAQDDASQSTGSSGGARSGQKGGDGQRGGSGGGHHSGGSSGGHHSSGSSGGSGTREFISYVGVRLEGGAHDPDGLTHTARMQLEEQAIKRILAVEPNLERTEAGNKGFDLVDRDLDGEPERWIEVKAMSGSLVNRPVGLSPMQIEHARRHGDQYWLYVVEHAASDTQARILKIRNPFGAAGTFTFDRGWEAIAEIHVCAEAQRDAAE